jgi:predicted amidophosphoribosyltransferase
MIKNKCKQCDIVLDRKTKDKICKRCQNRPQVAKDVCAYCGSKIDHDKYERKTYGNCCKKCNSVFVRKLKVKRAIKSVNISNAPQHIKDDLNYQYNKLTNEILKRRLYNDLKNKSIDLKTYLVKIELLLD